MYAIYLVSATSDMAGKVEFRDASQGPQGLKDVTVDAYGTTYMSPKGIHMYFSDLKRPLKEGDTVSITLTTELGVMVEVSALVKKE
jgi:copper(I)-binding protein